MPRLGYDHRTRRLPHGEPTWDDWGSHANRRGLPVAPVLGAPLAWGFPWLCPPWSSGCVFLPGLVLPVPLAPNAGGEPRPMAGATEERRLLGVGSTAMLGPASAPVPRAPCPRCGSPQGRWRRSGAGGVRSWSICLGFSCLSLSILAFHVLVCLSWPACLGVSPWFSCLAMPV